MYLPVCSTFSYKFCRKKGTISLAIAKLFMSAWPSQFHISSPFFPPAPPDLSPFLPVGAELPCCCMPAPVAELPMLKEP